MNNNLETKKRIYQILDKLSNGYNFNLSPETFSPNNEMVELIDILTNHNPYQQMQPVYINYTDIVNGDINALGAYFAGKHLIQYSLPFVKKVSENKENFMMLLDTIYHEQQHHYQDYFRENSDSIQTLDLKQITDGLLDGELSNDEVKELNTFANQHNLLGKTISKRKLRKLQFGAYLSKKCEIVARSTAYNNTCQTYEIMINDTLCSPKLKRFLKRAFRQYTEFYNLNSTSNKKDMKSFERLEDRVKSILMNAVKSDNEIDDNTYNSLLNGILDYTTKNMTLQENLEIATWALRHDYKYLLNRINLRNSLSSERRDLSNFINDILSKDLLTSENFTQVCNLFSSFNKSINDKAIAYLVENLADRASADILLSHADIGFGITFYSKYITPEIIEVSLKNYLNKIEHTKTITDYDKFLQTKEILNHALSNNDIKPQTKALLSSHLNKINKLSTNKEIKIIKKIEQEKEETLSM